MGWQATKGMTSDYDQAMFFIGSCYEGSGINASETLNNANFRPHPALGAILAWFKSHGSDAHESAMRRVWRPSFIVIGNPRTSPFQTAFPLRKPWGGGILMVRTRFNRGWPRRGLALLWDAEALADLTIPSKVLFRCGSSSL